MSASFRKGIASFQSGKLNDALEHFTQTINGEGRNDSNVYDSRAAVYEKLGKRKEALLDCKKVIELAPKRWQGYFRSARLFMALHKYDKAKSMLSMAQARVNSGDAKRLDELTVLQKQIERESAAFEEKLAAHRSKTYYHFGKIPFEIGMMIFTLALEGDPPKVIYLAQVCKDWRATILNAPSLWRTLSLDSRNPVRKARAWKSRCQGVIEHLHLNGSVDSAFDVLRDYDLTRLRSLSILNTSPDQVRRSLPNLTPSVLSRLTYLKVNYRSSPANLGDWMWEHPETQLQHIDVQAPNVPLRTLCENANNLRTFHLEKDFRGGDLPYLRLLLQNNPQLQSFGMISSPIGEVVDEQPFTPVHMRHLESITLRENALCRQIVGSLEAPHLRKLTLLYTAATHILTDISTRNFANELTHLRIDLCLISTHTLIAFLELTTNLEQLTVTGVYLKTINDVVDRLAGELTVEKSDEASEVVCLCPSLRYLDVSSCHQLQTGPILRLIKHRNLQPSISPTGQQISRIETLILNYCDLIESETLPWIRQMVPRVSCSYLSKKEASRRR